MCWLVLGQKWTDLVIFGLMEDTLVATPSIQTRVWRDAELSVRGVLAVAEIGPSMATLILISEGMWSKYVTFVNMAVVELKVDNHQNKIPAQDDRNRNEKQAYNSEPITFKSIKQQLPTFEHLTMFIIITWPFVLSNFMGRKL